MLFRSHWADDVGYYYQDEMDPPNHYDCWTGISEDPGNPDEAGCRKCGLGCDDFNDTRGDLFRYALWDGGISYLRSVEGDQFGRDAKNRIFDLLTNSPTLIQRRCRVEHGSCYENNPGALLSVPNFGGYVCWGHHVCQCTPGPTWTPVGSCDNLLQGGYPVDGLTADEFFSNHEGWPPTYGTSSQADLFCRKWLPVNSGASPRNAPIDVHVPGGLGGVYNAAFLRGRDGFSVDLLVPCAGLVAPSPCVHDSSPYDDCTYAGRSRAEMIEGSTRINEDDPESQGNFRELWISLDENDHLPDPIGLRSDAPTLSAQQLREHQLYADVFSEMIGRSYPAPEGEYLNMDRVSMPIEANNYIGFYERYFHGPNWPESELPRIIEFPHCRTRWGNVPITAHMVIVKCAIRVYLTVPHFAHFVRANPNEHRIKPYAVVEVQVETAMRCDPVTTGITVGGEPVVVTNPEWGSAPDGGYLGIPTATPDGNSIIYAREAGLPVRVPRKWRWFGRLGSFSDPATSVNPAYPLFSDVGMVGLDCGDLQDVIGTFAVPALATANESNPTDRNRNYAGSMSFFFGAT